MRIFSILALLVSFSLSARAGDAPEHVFLLIGQSNMAGRAALVDDDDHEINGVSLWNGESWEAAKPGFNRYSIHRKPNFTQGVNPGVGFVEAYRAAHPEVTVGIVCWARGGSSIREWSPEGKGLPLYAAAIEATQSALADGGKLIGVLWHQGESDSSRSDRYADKLEALVTSLRTDLKSAELPFVFSQLGQWREDYAAFNAMIVDVPKVIPFSACVTTEELTGLDKAHFDRAGQLELGRRFGKALLGLLEQR